MEKWALLYLLCDGDPKPGLGCYLEKIVLRFQLIIKLIKDVEYCIYVRKINYLVESSKCKS